MRLVVQFLLTQCSRSIIIMAQSRSHQNPTENDKTDVVPLFGSWRNAYIAVVIAFLVEVAVFYFVSRYFS